MHGRAYGECHSPALRAVSRPKGTIGEQYKTELFEFAVGIIVTRTIGKTAECACIFGAKQFRACLAVQVCAIADFVIAWSAIRAILSLVVAAGGRLRTQRIRELATFITGNRSGRTRAHFERA